MSLLPTYLNARKRRADLDLPVEPADETDSRPVFELVPPTPAEEIEPAEQAEPAEQIEQAAPEDHPQPGRNVHPINATDLSRLSIDADGRLYWDGKPVEVRRRILMSRAQVIGASLVAAFVIIGALGAVIQG